VVDPEALRETRPFFRELNDFGAAHVFNQQTGKNNPVLTKDLRTRQRHH
jgi:hypothetical protein